MVQGNTESLVEWRSQREIIREKSKENRSDKAEEFGTVRTHLQGNKRSMINKDGNAKNGRSGSTSWNVSGSVVPLAIDSLQR